MFTEAPGSQSFEMQDIPAIAKVAHDKARVVLMDNTWATPLYFRAFEKGVDMSIQAGTKYIGGHSDIMFGCVSANAATLAQFKDTVYTMGLCVGPDDMYLGAARPAHAWVCVLRGITKRACRSRDGWRNGRRSARVASRRSKPIPDMRSGSGISPAPAACSASCSSRRAKSSARLPERATLFGIGYSWGGFESLGDPVRLREYRTATKWSPGGPTVRFHIGLEDSDDLIADLERGFAALAD